MGTRQSVERRIPTCVLAENDRIVGYYSIAAGAIAVSEALG